MSNNKTIGGHRVLAGIASAISAALGFTSDMVISLLNASSTSVEAAEDATEFSVDTAGSETAVRILRFMLAGAKVVGAQLSGQGIQLPQGVTPGLQFDPNSGAQSGIGYDVNGPYLTFFINSLTRFHRLYTNAYLMDTASAAGGFGFDPSQAGGTYFSGSGTSITVRAGTIDGIECLVSGGIVWGRLVNSAASVAAAKCVTTNSSGLGIVADATTPTTCLGVTVAGAAGSGNLRFVRDGIATGVLSGATIGTRYYLGTAGALTTTRNTTSAQAQIQIGIAVSATDLLVQISDRGINP